MAAPSQQIHQRKSSRDEDENTIIVKPDVLSAKKGPPLVTIEPVPPPRIRTKSTPDNHGHNKSSTLSGGTTPLPPIPAPFRTNLPPPLLINGHLSPGSPFRSSFSVPLQPYSNGHSRHRSISTPFSSLPSPLSASFPPNSPSYLSPTIPNSYSAPEASQMGNEAKGSRRHARLHSRNLSFFFPRPGQDTINEDDAQELGFPVDVEAPMASSPRSNISFPGHRSPRQSLTPLGQGFTFGARPPSQGLTPDLMTAPHSARSTSSTTSTSTSSRRGHHHKHSLSHNFFSFLEPGSTPALNREELNQPTSRPLSPWNSVSVSPASVSPSQSAFNATIPNNNHVNVEDHGNVKPGQISYSAVAVSSIQFVLGAWLWVSGQHVGSISCTGLGYWVVFDSFGVTLSKVIPGWLSRSSNASLAERERERIRRPYGNGRVETVLMFAQAVYLMFSSVYVCKESVEHLLLSSGEGHHHHHGDEMEGLGIDFPIFIIVTTFISLLGTAIFYQNNTMIVNVTGNRIPSLGSIIRSLWTSRHTHELPPTTTLTLILSNPYVACPLFFCASILSVALILSPGQHRLADLILASLISAVTFKVAYQASQVLGTVLLQTSPRRGLSNGKMEAFLRALREIERHPQVVHLPPPHIWQLTPSLASSAVTTSSTCNAISDSLVVTLELHVKEDLGDDDILLLTKWVWERCVSALGSLKDMKGAIGGGPEVTIGVVRG